MIRSIIVEDEFYPREMLLQKLKDNHADIEVVSSCENAENALIETLRMQPDLLFLDIQLPDKSGLWLAEQLSQMICDTFTPPGVIFTTAYTDSEYLLNAFRLAAIDYLVKPIQPDNLSEAIERFKQRTISTPGIQTLMHVIRSEKILRFKNYSGLILLKPEDIAYVKADGNYAQIGLACGDTEEIFERLGEIEKTLPSEIFLRIGKSLIINRGYVRRINTKKSLLEITTPQTSYLLEVPEKGIKLLAQELTTSLNP
jgi:two-component system LytT family response regulator